MTCGIYLIENKKTGQKYIGLSENIEKRWYSHIHSPNLKTSYIDKAIRKYGKEKFFRAHDKLHEKYDFKKTQEVLGTSVEEGLKILEECNYV